MSNKSALESALRGLAQGVTFGFADEITGGLSALKDKLSGSDKSMGDLYDDNRDESRAEYDAARKDNPASYTIPSLAAGMLTGVPVAGALGGGLSGAVGAGAIGGAISGAGANEEEGEMLADVGQGAAVGGVLGGAGSATNASKEIPAQLSGLREYLRNP